MHMTEIYLNPDNDAVWEEKDNEQSPESRCGCLHACA